MARRRSSYSYYADFEPTRPIAAQDGLKARSQRGAFAKNWWAERWIEALERLMDTGRLSRGRSYARKGQVLSIVETKTGVAARVQGSRRTPYKIMIEIRPLTDDQWEKVQEQILQGLRQRRAGQEFVDDEEIEESEVVAPLEETFDHFWEIGRPVETFSVAIRHPTIEMPLLKRLGDPAFVTEPGIQALLRPAFQSISHMAQESAYADEEQDHRPGRELQNKD